MSFEGQRVLITGASSGLGLAVSKKFAHLGAHTIAVCRTRESCEEAVAEIRRAAPEASVEPMVCDLASMASVHEFVAEVKDNRPSLGLLFNNAAVMKRERTVTDDGFEMMFQVNYLSPFVLMRSLLELLGSSSTHLVLNVARPSEKLRLDFDNLQFSRRYSMYNSFFRTKLCLLLASLELAQRSESRRVSIHMTDPGRPFKSALVREAPWPVGSIKNLFSASVDEAADDIMHVALSDQAREQTGRVFKKGQLVSNVPYWEDPDVRQRLWDASQLMIDRASS
jgi:NAD(P)-dependent dehydrogenase (short-subunit alcohol dehydrogenase family)